MVLSILAGRPNGLFRRSVSFEFIILSWRAYGFGFHHRPLLRLGYHSMTPTFHVLGMNKWNGILIAWLSKMSFIIYQRFVFIAFVVKEGGGCLLILRNPERISQFRLCLFSVFDWTTNAKGGQPSLASHSKDILSRVAFLWISENSLKS